MECADRGVLVRRGLWLNYATIGYNTVEAVASLVAGFFARSVALIGFGLDSAIEVTAAGAAHWRLRADLDVARRERVERVTLRIIGASLLALAAYVLVDAVETLWLREAPKRTVAGPVILAISVVVMPLLARAKRRVAKGLASRALEADALQTSLCAYLSLIGLAGVLLNSTLGWWWADPMAALAMVPIIAREGLAGIRADRGCGDACC